MAKRTLIEKKTGEWTDSGTLDFEDEDRGFEPDFLHHPNDSHDNLNLNFYQILFITLDFQFNFFLNQ